MNNHLKQSQISEYNNTAKHVKFTTISKISTL